MRVLMVEDEPEMAKLVAGKLARSGFVADRVGSLDETMEALRQHKYSLVLLDRRLPDGDAISILPEIRRAQPSIRIVMLTARNAVEDRIEGLDAGADDYVTKPFDANELIARVRACLRRPGGEAATPIAVGRIVFHPDTRDVSVDGALVLFHKRERALLDILLLNAGRAVLRDRLLAEIYGFADDVQATALSMLVSRLRRRLLDLDAGVEIHTARDVGYLLTERKEK
ncbi:two-component system response regulator [Methylosinus sp. R-45379]|uniref:response regulator transcription factor n=1 Tax=unclassified Methylosinus TaxID=2624500 RepID=UPI000466A888|nr:MULTISPECIES: response regulator transcription factor [unclassified Methylosinus]OAI27633.1 two-component system response regulator [Methylosinus sp. R-45379]